MASLYKTVGKRVRLGQIAKRQAESVKTRVELLVAARITGTAPDAETSQWIAARDEGLLAKLAAVGLIDGPKRSTLGEFLKDYIAGRQALVDADKLSKRTLGIDKLTSDCLCEFFGLHKSLRDISEGDASDFRNWLLTSGSRPAKRCGPANVVRRRGPLDEPTVRKRCAIASRFLRYAKDHDLIHRNPFDSVAKANIAGDKKAFISDADARKVMAALPDTQWQLLFALARWGGLRIGSEVRELTWGDIDWAGRLIHIRSPKTKRYQGRETRLIPLFPELAPLLGKRFEEAAEGETAVLPMLVGKSDAALRDPMIRAITNAGLIVWPKLWVNLRSTRETELSERHPMKTVCAWIGNSEAIASKHYLQVPAEHYSLATGEQAVNEMLSGRKSGANSGTATVGR